ncbi:hypothetical protein F5882DRAFT_80048, partial [Hyaloscypha sp. PMI_1271]
ILQESGVQVGASPVSPGGSAVHLPRPHWAICLPISTTPTQDVPGRPTTPPASQAVWDSWRPAGRRASFGLSGTNPFCIQSPPHGTCKVAPPPPPEISSPGLAAATSGMAPPVRLNFELQPSNPQGLEASKPRTGSAILGGIPAHVAWVRGPPGAKTQSLSTSVVAGEAILEKAGKGSKRPGRLTPSTPGSAHVPGPTNEPNGRPTTNRRAGVFPDGGNICLAMGGPHPQSYIRVVDPPPEISPFLLFNHIPFGPVSFQ